MCKTEKEKRLESALMQALLDPQCYGFEEELVGITDVTVNLQHIIDKDGYELKDLTILEEAISGDFTGSLRITIGSADAKVSQRCHITYGGFRIIRYENGEFIIEVSKPITIE